MAEAKLEPTEVLEPKASNYRVVLSEGNSNELILIQKPLSFFGKIEFFSVMSSAIDKALSDGLSVSDLLDTPQRTSELNEDSFKEADLFVKSLLKLVKYAPDLLFDLYVVFLGVPRGDRDYVIERLRDELTDEQGIGIINAFVDQNWDVLVSFFKEQILPLVSKISKKVAGQESESSKPSKATPRTTPKQ